MVESLIQLASCFYYVIWLLRLTSELTGQA